MSYSTRVVRFSAPITSLDDFARQCLGPGHSRSERRRFCREYKLFLLTAERLKQRSGWEALGGSFTFARSGERALVIPYASGKIPRPIHIAPAGTA